MKPTEPATLLALLDDYAALGDSYRIEEMGERARKKAAKALSQSLPRTVWAHVAAACAYRALAIRARLGGRVQIALGHEQKSEQALNNVYAMTRGRN